MIDTVHEGDGSEHLILAVPDNRAGQRLDHYLVDRVASVSRTRVAKLIRDGFVLLNGSSSKVSARLKEGDRVEVIIPAPKPTMIEPEKVRFEVLFEDEEILVLAKPPGVVVHPAAGHRKGTLVHGLMYHCDTLPVISGVERPGIVHRLDKDTSGVMVIAKTEKSHHGLVDQFKYRQVKKVYHAIVAGKPTSSQGVIDRPVGRHQGNRKKMAVLEHGGREAVTAWSVMEEFSTPLTYMKVRPETGRTHQIRVHMAHMGCPVVGDVLYGSKLSKQLSAEFSVKRQCLHAYSLSFIHPVSETQHKFVSPVWPDMLQVLEKLREQTLNTGSN